MKRVRTRPYRIETLEPRCLLTVTAPVILPIVVTEGQLFSGRVATFTSNDPSPQSASNYVATVSWGDGTIISNLPVTVNMTSAGKFDVSASNTYFEEGSYPLAVTIRDLVDATSASSSVTLSVGDASLTTSSKTINATEGTAVTDIVATFTDADPSGTVSDYTAAIDWGDGHTSLGTITANSSGGFNVTGTNTYSVKGSYPVAVVIRDVGGASATANSTAVAADAPLQALPATVVATEGKSLTNVTVATFTDAGGTDPASSYTVTINWGDGTALDTTTGVVSGSGGNFTVRGTHTYSEEGAFPVVVTIADEAVGGVPNSVVTAAETATVADASLTLAATGPVIATAGTPLGTIAIAMFTDADPNGTTSDYAATIDWGDGTPEAHGIITASGSTFAVSGGHTFFSLGTFNGTVTVRDLGGSVATVPFTTAVSNVTLTVVPVTAVEGVALTNTTVATIQGGGGPSPAAGYYTATIDWGDNSQPTAGTISGSGSTLSVVGSHVYAESGAYPIRVVVGIPNNPNLVAASGSATVADVPIVLTGMLNPASDSGVSNQDHITNVTQPNFFGKSEAGSVVQLFAQQAGGTPFLIGQTVADAGGAWSITSNVRLADGTNNIIATAVDRSFVTRATTMLTPVVIDTLGPRVTAVSLDRLHGRFTVTFQDERSGLDLGTLIDGAHYRITRPNTRLGHFRITSLTTTGPAGPTGAVTVTGLINGGRRIRYGSYDIFVRSGGITDVTGNALDGQFYGFFPSGSATHGRDFLARIDTANRIVSAPQPVGSSASPLSPPGTPGQRVIIGRKGLN